MTIFIADVASYQQGLTLADLTQSGFTGINVKISHELGIKSVHPDARSFVAAAKDSGIGVSTFHWLTGRAPGADQAAFAYTQMQSLPGGTIGLAHVVDVEDETYPPTLVQWQDYCATMHRLLGRPIATYSGDWWWLDRMGSAAGGGAHSPWLWSAPRDGYLAGYPGDAATAAWRGYGGWPLLTAMQFAVAPVAGIQVSQSAIRDNAVWDRMRGVDMAINSLPASTSLLAEFNFLAPDREKAQDGTIGDQAHADRPSDHNADETGNTGGMEDADNIDEVHARDVDSRGPWPAGWSMERCVQIILKRCRAGTEKRPLYIIFNRRIWAAGTATPWQEREYTGVDPHDKHAHFSLKYGSGSGTSNPENITSAWGIRAARQEELDMELTDQNLKDIAEAVAVRLRIGDKGVMDKLGADLDNDDSGVAKGIRKQVTAVLNPPAKK